MRVNNKPKGKINSLFIQTSEKILTKKMTHFIKSTNQHRVFFRAL